MKNYTFFLLVFLSAKVSAQCTPPVAITVYSPTTGTTPCPNSFYNLLASPNNIGPYQWTLNGIVSTTTDYVAPYNGTTLVQGDVITCAPISNLYCPTIYTVDYTRPHYLTMSVSPSSTIQAGTNTTFITSLGHGALLYLYAFYVNNIQVFTSANNQPTFSYFTNSLQNGDVVYSTLKANPNGNPCGYIDTSNVITMLVSAILPVTFSQFNVNTLGKKFLLDWTTTTETDLAYFNVQESLDGQPFTTIGKVLGNQNASAIKQYTFNYQPFYLDDHQHYFRLQVISKDGNPTYSTIQKASFVTVNKLEITPNPATNFISINGADVIQVKLLTHQANYCWNKKIVKIAIS